jgi:hypothetical protein
MTHVNKHLKRIAHQKLNDWYPVLKPKTSSDLYMFSVHFKKFVVHPMGQISQNSYLIIPTMKIMIASYLLKII